MLGLFLKAKEHPKRKSPERLSPPVHLPPRVLLGALRVLLRALRVLPRAHRGLSRSFLAHRQALLAHHQCRLHWMNQPLLPKPFKMTEKGPGLQLVYSWQQGCACLVWTVSSQILQGAHSSCTQGLVERKACAGRRSCHPELLHLRGRSPNRRASPMAPRTSGSRELRWSACPI